MSQCLITVTSLLLGIGPNSLLDTMIYFLFFGEPGTLRLHNLLLERHELTSM